MNNPPGPLKAKAGAEPVAPQKFEPSTLRGVPTQTNFLNFFKNDDGVVTGNNNKAASESKFIGAAGEALVQYDLLRRDIECHHASHIHSYDLIAIKDYSFIKIEVKTTAKVDCRNNGYKRYSFTINGKGRNNRYEESGVGIFAFVALDIASILYFKAGDFDFSARHKHILAHHFKDSNLSFNRCFL